MLYEWSSSAHVLKESQWLCDSEVELILSVIVKLPQHVVSCNVGVLEDKT